MLQDDDDDVATVIAPSREMLAGLQGLRPASPPPAAGTPAIPAPLPAAGVPAGVAAPPPRPALPTLPSTAAAAQPVADTRAPGWVTAVLVLFGLLSVAGVGVLAYLKTLHWW